MRSKKCLAHSQCFPNPESVLSAATCAGVCLGLISLNIGELLREERKMREKRPR